MSKNGKSRGTKSPQPIETALEVNDPEANEAEIERKQELETLRHKYPGGMNKYERSWGYQLFMLLFLFAIAVGNTRLNFSLIRVFDDLINALETAPDPDQATIDQLLQEFQNNTDASACDITFFADDFKKNDYIDAIKRVQRVVKFSAYMAVGFMIWITFLIKALSAYNLVNEDFNVTRPEELLANRKNNIASALETDHPQVKHVGDANVDVNDIIRTAGGKRKINLETEGEKKIRIYLRSETVLFGCNQVVQDIPVATACILYLLFLTRERGVLCFEAFTQGKIENSFSIDNADPVVFGQLVLILLSIFGNMVLNLIPRWVTYFHYLTIKHAHQPRSTTVRAVNIGLWTFAYLLAVFMPLFCILYSPVGNELFGLQTTGNLGLLVLALFSGACLSIGAFLICCYWGHQFGESLCVCLVLCDAVEIGCEGCLHIEICEFMPDGSGCCCCC